MKEFKNPDISYLGRVNFRNSKQVFGIKQADRLLHTYIIGKTGTGKTTLLKTKILQDINNGQGICLLDPHGDLVTEIHSNIPEHRKKDVIYMDITDPKQPFAYNPLKKVAYEKRSLVASSIIEVFKKLWSQAWGVKLEHILRFSLLALLDQPKAKMSDISKMMYDNNLAFAAIVISEN